MIFSIWVDGVYYYINELEMELKSGRGQHRKYLPFAFTEHGAIMAATILNSPRATEVSVYVVRAFVRLREVLASSKELAKRLDDLERTTEARALQHDQFARNTRVQLKQVFGKRSFEDIFNLNQE